MMTTSLPRSATKLRVAAASDKGKVRVFNEDSYLIDESLGLFIVADGMGGHEHGKTASKMACNIIQQQVQQNIDVSSAIQCAHSKIQHLGKEIASGRGMGTTVVVAKLAAHNMLDIWWLGDSRAYQHTRDTLTLLTHDHSKVQELVDREIITMEEAQRHPQRNIITRSLGMSALNEVDVDKVSTMLNPNTSILLCTDGLTNELNEHEISDWLNTQLDTQQKTEGIISAVNQKESRDNVSVLLLQFTGHSKF